MKSFTSIFFICAFLSNIAGMQAQAICKDQYNASAQVEAAINKIDEVNNCTGTNYYTCRDAFQNLYSAENRLTRAVNQSIDDQCVTCDLTDLHMIASDINLAFSVLTNMGYSSYHTNLEFTTFQWMDPKYRCMESTLHTAGSTTGSERKYAGDWYDPMRGIMTLRQSGRRISGSARGVKSGDHWGSGHRENIRIEGEVLVDGSLRLEMYNGDGTFTECRLDLPDQHLTGHWTWYSDTSKHSKRGGGSITLTRRT